MYRRNQGRIIAIFLTPALILYLVFVIYPDISALWLSLQEWGGLREMTYIGLDNYTQMFQDDTFWLALSHNVFFVIVTLVVVTSLALLLAVILTRRLRGAGFFRTVYFFPITISIVAVAAVWKMIYNPLWGPPAVFLNSMGQRPIMWLGDQNIVLWSLAIVIIWQGVGFHMTLYIAGIKNIPPVLFEAARIDGAGPWQEFRFITLPLLWDVVRISIAFLIIGGLNIFAIIRVMMQYAGTDIPESVHTLATYMYERAFTWSNYGYGTAIAIVLFLLTMVVTLLSLFATQRREALQF